jgi:hypothetical protein
MSSFNVNNDDAAFRLRPSNSRAVKEVQAYPIATPAQKDERNAKNTQKTQREERRRERERRHQSRQVLLNTRSGHDRRNVTNGSTEDSGKKTKTGISVYT